MVAQAYAIHKAHRPLGNAEAKRFKSNPAYSKAPEERGREREVHRLMTNRGSMGVVEKIPQEVSMTDEAVFILQGATALTVDVASWERLAVAYGENVKPIKIIIFETVGTRLAKTDHYEDLGRDYCVGEYDLPLIGQYLRNQSSAPEPYATLFSVWSGALDARIIGEQVANLRVTHEGQGRANQNKRTSRK